jgi:transcriptional regulator
MVILTKKEIIILKLKNKNLTQEQIAKKLKISQPAVSKFYKNALKKIEQAKEILRISKEIKSSGEKK